MRRGYLVSGLGFWGHRFISLMLLSYWLDSSYLMYLISSNDLWLFIRIIVLYFYELLSSYMFHPFCDYPLWDHLSMGLSWLSDCTYWTENYTQYYEVRPVETVNFISLNMYCSCALSLKHKLILLKYFWIMNFLNHILLFDRWFNYLITI